MNIDNGTAIVASETSGAVPTISAIVTFINDARIAAGKNPVGESDSPCMNWVVEFTLNPHEGFINPVVREVCIYS